MWTAPPVPIHTHECDNGTAPWGAELALVPIPIMSTMSSDTVILWELRLQGFSFPLSPIFVAALCLVGELCDGGLAASLYRVPSALLVGTTLPQVLEISCSQVKGQW